MPRSPTTYTLPPGTTPQQPNTVIGSAMFNAAMDDIAGTFNTPQPLEFGGTGATNAPGAYANLSGFSTTATAAGTTTLTASSARSQFFTGTTTQTVTLPVVSTLVLGQQYRIVNNSTGLVTVQSSGANTIQVMGGSGTELVLTCIAITGTGVASWDAKYIPPNTGWVAYTPTFTGFGTVANVSYFSRRVGDTLEIRGRFQSGTPTAVEARVSLGFNGVNGGITARADQTPIRYVGAGVFSVGAVYQPVVLSEAGAGYVVFAAQGGSDGGLTKLNGNSLFAAGTVFSFTGSVPITGW